MDDRSAVVEVLLAILRDVLDSDAVQPDDDLWDLGVDSMVIAKTATRVRARLGIDAPLTTYFDAGTVAELGQALTQVRAQTGTSR